ncbi:amidohydrolase family protein [Haloterrigena alkaliphila]|uniref:Amidohydrolase family protein n=1 Tax=Haloterrigena alkaliphila TaxID=2816475 RepID=A0A8A2V9Q3_9EURY|nr:amidohydrolase family protein [Haloterrigena alkaliphila]QSW98201.1 amidohydrolase family protein [Haloterrigena alkaliphila]
MVSLDEVFVADAVTHAYNQTESNYRVPRYAEQIAEIGVGLESKMPEGYARTPESFLGDWPVENTENALFRESQTDFAVFHPQSIRVFHDGLTAEEKARQFVERNPTRGAALASIDAIGLDDPQAELTRQVEEFDPHGVKVYPSYWEEDGNHHGFRMDDPEVAFPLWEHAADLGLDVVAVHKAFPFGAVPMDSYEVGDVEEAAASFPDLTFEIVHGGLTFAEETGWQIARHPNVYVNLELTLTELVTTPDSFVDTLQDLLFAGGERALEKILWGTGAPHFHPQLLLERFWEYDFPEMESFSGSFEITQEDKRKILGENWAEAHGFDIDDLESAMEGDQYSDAELVEEPWATTEFEVAE